MFAFVRSPWVVVALFGTMFVACEVHAQQHGASWQPLGVYSILNQSGRPTSRYLTLYIDANGKLRGSYRDPVSDTSQRLRGRIDSVTGEISWSFDAVPLATFRTTAADLMQPFGVIEITSADGMRDRWHIARQQ